MPVARAIKVLSSRADAPAPSKQLQRILMFIGLRVDTETTTPDSHAAARPADAAAVVKARQGFPTSSIEAARQAIEQAIDAETKLGGEIAFGIAAGANGGDLLFHEICQARGIPTRLCLALRRPQYVGQYVAPVGKAWVEKFSTVYRHLRTQDESTDPSARHVARHINEFTDSGELPRWLQGKPFYNVGRRNNQWMLQHAITAAYELGDNAEITLIALWNEGASEGGIGGIGDVIRTAAMQGIKVHTIPVPRLPAAAAPDPRDSGEAEAPASKPAPSVVPRVDAERSAARRATV